MFLSREQKETRRQLQARIKELESHVQHLKARLKERQDEYNKALEAYKQSVSEKWEYLEVGHRQDYRTIKTWDVVNALGLMGWELVGISTFAEGYGAMTVYTKYVFKRRLPPLSDDLLSRFSDIQDLEIEILGADVEIAGAQAEIRKL